MCCVTVFWHACVVYRANQHLHQYGVSTQWHFKALRCACTSDRELSAQSCVPEYFFYSKSGMLDAEAVCDAAVYSVTWLCV